MSNDRLLISSQIERFLSSSKGSVMDRAGVFICFLAFSIFGASSASAVPCQSTQALRSGTAATALTMHANMALAHLRVHHQRARDLGKHQVWLKQRQSLGGKVQTTATKALQQLLVVKTSLLAQFAKRQSLVLAELDLAVGTVDTWLMRYQQCRKKWFPKGDDKQTIEKERKRIQNAIRKVSQEMGQAMRAPLKARKLLPLYQKRLRLLQLKSLELGVVNVRNSLRQTRQRLLRERQKAAALKL